MLTLAAGIRAPRTDPKTTEGLEQREITATGADFFAARAAIDDQKPDDWTVLYVRVEPVS
ncbi:hypothetical protein GCM10023340_39080 [Nocardioides marinquilinus]|uniref:Uncharacterized protein n=1 Tax=Nocardioides marinquilinus TaxID=1210400 RepID=A0ABP9PZL3_9ACTN